MSGGWEAKSCEDCNMAPPVLKLILATLDGEVRDCLFLCRDCAEDRGLKSGLPYRQ